MTRIEGEPLLVEDLEGRRKELLSDVRTILEKSDGWLKEEIRERVYPRFLSNGFLWRQISRREELKALLAQARQEFKDRTTRQTTEEERDLLIAAVETAVTLRRVDAPGAALVAACLDSTAHSCDGSDARADAGPHWPGGFL